MCVVSYRHIGLVVGIRIECDYAGYGHPEVMDLPEVYGSRHDCVDKYVWYRLRYAHLYLD